MNKVQDLQAHAQSVKLLMGAAHAIARAVGKGDGDWASAEYDLWEATVNSGLVTDIGRDTTQYILDEAFKAELGESNTIPKSATLPDSRHAGPALPPCRLEPLDLSDFLARNIPERGMIVDPVLPEKGLTMIYSARGCGKTHLACGLSFAAATGGTFLKWAAAEPRKVLHVDGEMPAADLQQRFEQIIAGRDTPASDMLKILTADLTETGIGNLASPKVQLELDAHLDGLDLLVLDNLSSLTAVIRDNDAESWTPIQEWLLRLRRRGVSVMLLHHAGKGGAQRGTSRREDVLDVSISLRRPSDYTPEQGARFEIHFEKARGVHGDRVKPFEARMETRDGATQWTCREIEDVNQSRVQALLEGGFSVRDIADETGIPKSTVHRLKQTIERMAAQTDTPAATE